MSSFKRKCSDDVIRCYESKDSSTLHCIDGPAVEWPDGYKAWYVNGLLHRLDGPAREGPCKPYGKRQYYEYWINGKFIGSTESGYTDDMFKSYVKLLAFV